MMTAELAPRRARISAVSRRLIFLTASLDGLVSSGYDGFVWLHSDGFIWPHLEIG
jgi:hypothetical protein